MKLKLLTPVNDRHKSHALWAAQPSGTLVVFVHGFIGNAVTTWIQFPLMLFRAEAKDNDYLFFGHNGGRSQIQAVVGLLSEAIEKLWVNPKSFGSFPQERVDFHFGRIVICAHSMGCVVARDAVVAAAESGKPWAKHVSLVMFAPAHKGVFDSLLLAEKFLNLRGMVGQWPMAAFHHIYPVVKDLRPNSKYLRLLESRTDALCAHPEFGPSVLAKAVICGEHDKTVEQDQFSKDPYPARSLPKNHITVCKPTPLLFEQPYEALLESL